MKTCLLVLCLGLLAVRVAAHEAEERIYARVSAEIAAQPQDAALWVRRAALCLEMRDWQACLTDLERAERLGEMDLELLRARALVCGKHFEHALAVLRPLEQHAGSLRLRAQTQAALKNFAQAAVDAEKVLQLTPRPEPDDYLECAGFLCQAGRPADALAMLDRAPQTIVIVERAMPLEKPAAALRRLDALIATSQVKEPLLAKKAVFLAQNGREADSAAAWRTLAERITALPPQARGSHAMSKLAQQAHHALAALQHTHSTP